ncbi:Survival motor neuron protein [Trichinella murrelli]|uniref:Survival motor neuron protein n=1 Tax=Trichinella murrelli TaxID=144512 RepID=A0A0V0TZ56_9BILA|nr:Survival motor neuron protein [Trichinella murrelli]
MDRRMLWLGLFSVCAIILFETVKADLTSETGVVDSSSAVLEEVPHCVVFIEYLDCLEQLEGTSTENDENVLKNQGVKLEERAEEEPDRRKGKIELTEDKIDEDQGMIEIENHWLFYRHENKQQPIWNLTLFINFLQIFVLMMSDKIPENDLSPGTDDDEISECWDDKEMIKMYEESLSLVELQLSNKTDGKQQKEKRKSKHASSKLEVESDTKPKEGIVMSLSCTAVSLFYCPNADWKVGDRCLAKYSEDGAFYLAEILKLFPEKKSCQVIEIDETVHISSSKAVESEIGESRNEVMADADIRNEEKPSKTTRKPVLDKGNINFDFLLPRIPPPILTDFHGADPNLNAMLISRYLAGYYDALYLTQLDKKKHTSK